ncbi:hypothetical protein [Streptomyces sp. NPDC054849]
MPGGICRPGRLVRGEGVGGETAGPRGAEGGLLPGAVVVARQMRRSFARGMAVVGLVVR